MADYAFFYNSEDGDRKYDADSFSDWLKKFFTSGVFEGDLQVTATNSMQIKVGSGYVNIGGKVRMFDTKTDVLLTTAHPTYDRIDTIVAERNDTERNITIKVVTGGYSTNPIPTAPVRSNGVYQLVLAQIYVAAGATAISQAVITDKRTDESVCGLVYTPVDTFDFDQFATQFNAYFAEFKDTKETDFNNWSVARRQDFDNWFANLVYVLDGDVAGHLQNEIDEINAKMNKTGGSNIKVTFADELEGMAATLTTPVGAYTQVVTNHEALFNGILEIGPMTVECDGNTASVNIQFYSWYELNIGIKPAFGYEGWLDSASITTSYASLEEVLADEPTVRILMTKHASVDYLVEWLEADDTEATNILGNDLCAKWINLRDYALDTLWASTTCKGVMDSVDKYGYGEWVKNADGTWGAKGNVPIMTSNTAPYGEVIKSGELSGGGFEGYRAFDNNATTEWNSGTKNASFIGYKFTNPINVRRFAFAIRKASADWAIKTFNLQYSDDGSTYTNVGGKFTARETTDLQYFDAQDVGYHLYWRINVDALTTNYITCYTLQFYGRELTGLVPPMTSNTTPYGECGASDADITNAYQSFDGNEDTSASSSTSRRSLYVYYKFPQKTNVLMAKVKPNFNNAPSVIEALFQYSDDGNVWTPASEATTIANKTDFVVSINVGEHQYWRSDLSFGTQSKGSHGNVQFYGLDYSEHTERHYIYDHGVEVEELESYVGNPIEKKSSSIISSRSGSTNQYVGTSAQLNLDSAKAIVCRLLQLSANQIMLFSATTKATSSSACSSTGIASGTDKAICDLNNVNGNQYIGFSHYGGASTIEFNELYLQK